MNENLNPNDEPANESKSTDPLIKKSTGFGQASVSESGAFILQTRFNSEELSQLESKMSIRPADGEESSEQSNEKLQEGVVNPPLEEMLVLDSESALEIAAGDPGLVEVLIETCLEETPNIIDRAKACLESNDFDTARGCGHSLRSSLSNIGATRASETSRLLEFCESDKVSDFNEAIAKVEAAFSELKDFIKSRPG